MVTSTTRLPFTLVLVILVALGDIQLVSGRARTSLLRGQEAGPYDKTYLSLRRYLQLFGRGDRMRGNGSQGGEGARVSMENRPVMRTSVPTPPTPAPTPSSSPTISCEPTSGQCVPMTSGDLQAALDNASDGDTIALCGGNTPLITGSDLVVQRDDLTICCASQDDLCTLESTGNDRILSLFGLLGATLKRLHFRNGMSQLLGGNVLIQGSPSTAVGQRGDFLFENCRFDGGKATSGGNLGVRNVDRIVVRDCIFEGGETTSGGSGGNLYVSGELQEPVGTAIVERTSFDSGFSSRGANVFVQSIADVSIVGSSIKNGAGFVNVNTQGGGASISNVNDVAVSNSTFEGNKCSFSAESNGSVIGARGGGALISIANDVTISDSSFQNNECSFGGNLAVNTVGNNVMVTRSTFKRGIVPGTIEGRGAGALINNVNAAVLISDSLFEENKCSFATEGRGGGARIVTVKNVVVRDSIFQDNECSVSSGNLDITFVDNVTVTRSTFKRGVVTNTTEGRSGNLDLVGAQKVRIEESIFEEGKASIYANMLINGVQVELVATHFSNDIANVDDTGIIGSESVAISNATFVRSTVRISGTTDTIIIEDCSFRDGIADSGGNVRISSGSEKQIVVRRSRFEGGATLMPASSGQGGNLYISGGNLFAAVVTIEESMFDGGKSYRNGGNLFVDGINQLTIDDSTFLNGFSELGTGGGAAIRTSNATISTSIFAGGQAVSGGGIYIFTPMQGTEVSILDSTFELNNATTIGGAFGLLGEAFSAALTIVDSEFTSNSADNTGGVGVIVGSSVQFTLTGNTANNNVGNPCDEIVTSSAPCLGVNGGVLPV